jgi:hypothetical protein
MFIFFPGPESEIFRPGTHTRIKELKYFSPKKWFLTSRKYDPGCLWILIFLPIPDPGVKKAPDPWYGSAKLHTIIIIIAYTTTHAFVWIFKQQYRNLGWIRNR